MYGATLALAGFWNNQERRTWHVRYGHVARECEQCKGTVDGQFRRWLRDQRQLRRWLRDQRQVYRPAMVAPPNSGMPSWIAA